MTTVLGCHLGTSRTCLLQGLGAPAGTVRTVGDHSLAPCVPTCTGGRHRGTVWRKFQSRKGLHQNRK